MTLAPGRPVVRRERPRDAAVERLVVLRSTRMAPGYQRVTLGSGPVASRFRPLGYDQWFRLFLPVGPGEPVVPSGGAEGWYERWKAIPDPDRSTLRNYTVREARAAGEGWEIDVDFVVHGGPAGVDGIAADWALSATPGDPVGFLDQGVIFQRPETRRMVLEVDETGLPGLEGILRDLDPGVAATAVDEIPHPDDRRELPTAAALDLRWVVRGQGRSRIAESLAGAPLARTEYVYTVGESAFVQAVRREALAAGVPRSRIEFCAYWNSARG